MGYYFRDYDYPDIDLEPEPEINLENEIGKLLETLVIGLTGKNLDQQRELVIESIVHVSSKISKSGDSFGQRLADESEGHMLTKIVKGMDDLSIRGMLRKLRKSIRVSQMLG